MKIKLISLEINDDLSGFPYSVHRRRCWFQFFEAPLINGLLSIGKETKNTWKCWKRNTWGKNGGYAENVPSMDNIDISSINSSCLDLERSTFVVFGKQNFVPLVVVRYNSEISKDVEPGRGGASFRDAWLRLGSEGKQRGIVTASKNWSHEYPDLKERLRASLFRIAH